MTFDLLIKSGTVIDPAQELNAIRDVAFSGGKVAALGTGMEENEAREVVDAAGMLVTPGLIDLHVHAYWGVSHYGIDPDYANIRRGVTTALDAGSAGAQTFGAFRRYVLERCETRLFALLNISAIGLLSNRIGELQDLRFANTREALDVGHNNRDYILGVKARLSRGRAGNNDQEVLKRSIEVARELGGFVMIHVKDTYTPLEKLTAMLRPGDVVTHSFHGYPGGVLDDRGRVIEGLRSDQERGVVFDVGHGSGSFSFEVAEKAMSQGFYPGNISSDLHIGNIDRTVFDLITVLSKFMHLGMSLPDVVRLSTETPARIMGMGDTLGTLRVGAEGDAAILRLDEGRFALRDSRGRTVQARQKLSHIRTVKGGRIYRPWLS